MQRRFQWTVVVLMMSLLWETTTCDAQTGPWAYTAPQTSSSLIEPTPDAASWPSASQTSWPVPDSLLDPVAVNPPPPFPVRLDTDLMAPLLDFQNRQSEKELLVLQSQTANSGDPTLLIGAQFRASMLASWSNSSNKFNYLGRFPPDFTGTTASDIRLLHANQGFVAHASPWVSGYLETLFSDVFSFPAFDQGSFQVRQAYVTLGNLDELPIYAFAGKKTVSFGHMGTLSPFSQSVVWHYFAPLAEGGGIAYHDDILHLSATALNGSRGIRVADSNVRGELNNFAANANVTVISSPDVDLDIGGGYLDGTIYDGQVAEHLDSTVGGPMNAAWDAYMTARIGWLHLAGEYLTTLKEWPVTGHKVVAYRAEGAIDLSPLWLSVSWSEGVQGNQSTEFEFNQQLVLGTEYRIAPNIKFSIEYIRSLGFAPLINITTVSDKSVRQNTFLLGVTVAI
ncbi:MAG: hypothetical protein KDA93_04060 [Planctomycetaceae bacterium]|nr:hypothetical protein [Planctomycetaceae bacterium]